MIDLNEQENTKVLSNVIMVDMGECIILDNKSKKYLVTDGLGPCVGVAVVITTVNGEVYRLLGHIILEEETHDSFYTLKIHCSEIKSSANRSGIKSIDISFTTSQSYRNRNNLSEDEIALIAIIKKEFGLGIRNISFNCEQQVQISPNGIISTNFEDIMVDQNSHDRQRK